MATTQAPVRALEHVEQALELLHDVSLSRPDGGDDPRLGLLWRLAENWDATDERFTSAKSLLLHDSHPYGAIPCEALGAIVTIIDKLEEFFTDFVSSGRDPVEMREDARVLRDAYERLGEIVAALVAFPLLEIGR